MSYPSINNDFLSDLLNRKELYSLKITDYNFREPPGEHEDIYLGKYLKLRPYQLFVQNIMNPDTPYKRLHLMYGTGSGKTLAAIAISKTFINVYINIYNIYSSKLPPNRKNNYELDKMTPSVFVLGFGGTKAAFINELLKYPEFGYITIDEKDELLRRKKMTESKLPDDIKYYKELYSNIKRRVTNKSKSGYYKFFGYDEFVNRLFYGKDIKLIDLENEYKLRKDEVTLEDIFREYINDGRLRVNFTLLSMFENSLLVCDEIHNTYNTGTKNNRGVAIQFILDHVKNLRFLSLSATPINNSPTEVVELINYLVPVDKKITKKQMFLNPRTLYPDKLEEIGKLTRGYVLFLQDINIKFYPKRIMMGEYLTLPIAVQDFKSGDHLPYLKFTMCPMSEYHQKTYNEYVSSEHVDVDKQDDEEEETSRLIPTDGYSIYDIAFPNPDTDEYGMFRSSIIRSKINAADNDWKDKNQINMVKDSMNNYIFTGSFLHYDNIGKYSTKYKTLLDIIFDIIKQSDGDPSKCQKIMIYHDRKIMSGTLLIQELLRTNNIIDEYSDPIDSTICCVCGTALGEHSMVVTHEYAPVRFVMAHSDIDKITMNESLLKYNSISNSNGLQYMILVGSRIIKESYDFKDIQNMIVISLPVNIPTLLQVFGRAIRTNSHINLPPEQRQVKIHMLISTNNSRLPVQDPISPEIHRYADKLSQYITIQKIEREINKNAIDADIYRDIIMPKSLQEEYFPNGLGHNPIDRLGNLYFEPSYIVPMYSLKDLNKTTFSAYKHYDKEIQTILYIIKRLFIYRPVWTFEEIWEAVLRPPFSIDINPDLFNKCNYIIALNNLITRNLPIATTEHPEISQFLLAHQLMDPNNKKIYINGVIHEIRHIGKYYILFPIIVPGRRVLTAALPPHTERQKIYERVVTKTFEQLSEHVMIDVDTYLRPMKPQQSVSINVHGFIKNYRTNMGYSRYKEKFISEFNMYGTKTIFKFLYEYTSSFQEKFIEEAIINRLDNNTSPIYDAVINLMNQFEVLITIKELSKYKDVLKQFKDGLPDLPPDTPLGYMVSKLVRLYNINTKQWFNINKMSLNRHIVAREVGSIIGYFEDSESGMKFKLRKPVGKTTAKDMREVERGIVCGTKSKTDLIEILVSLGVNVQKIDKSDIRTKNLCARIMEKLLNLEIKERANRTFTKYVYSWWDNI